MIIKSNEIPVLIKGHWAARGLMGIWPMMPYEVGGNKVFDLSGNRNTGTFAGTAPSWTSGKFGTAVLFPGTDEYIDCGNNATVLSATGAIVVWLKVDALPSGDEVFISAYDGGDINFNRLRMQLDSGGKFDTFLNSAPDNVDMVNDGLIVAGVWTQIVFTWDATFGYLYQDGVFLASDAKTVGNDTWYPFTIGANLDSPITYFAGTIDHVLNYHRFLSASEIALLHREPFCMFERDPIELWVGSVGAGAPPGTILQQITNAYMKVSA